MVEPYVSTVWEEILKQKQKCKVNHKIQRSTEVQLEDITQNEQKDCECKFVC